jgi:Fur family ferric uptake transcriptional regulator/Fur family peroxide stress response transcriptional regulator
MNNDKLPTTKRSLQQDAVRAAVAERSDHPTAEQVHEAARCSCPKISLATVYRNLDRLVDEGAVGKFAVPGEPDHYDPLQGEHYHVRCLCCGVINNIDIKIAHRLSRLIRRQTGIDMQSIQLLAEGVCEQCNKTRKETV